MKKNIVLFLFLSIIFSNQCVSAQTEPEPQISSEETTAPQEAVDIQSHVETAKEGKIDLDKAKERLEAEKKAVEKEKAQIEKSVERVNGEGEKARVLQAQLEAVQKKEEALTAEELTIQEKVEAYEQVAQLLENKTRIRGNKDLRLEDIWLMKADVKILLREAQQDKKAAMRKIELINLEARADEQELAAKNMIMDLKGDESGTLTTSIQAIKEQITAASVEKALVEERISFIDVQIELLEDYMKALNQKRWSILRYDLFTRRPFELETKEIVFSGIFLFAFIIALFFRKIIQRKHGNDEPTQGQRLAERTVNSVVFGGGALFVFYWIAAFMGYKLFGGYFVWDVALLWGFILFFCAFKFFVNIVIKKVQMAMFPKTEEAAASGKGFLDFVGTLVVVGFFFICAYLLLYFMDFEHEAGIFLTEFIQKPFFVLGDIKISVWIILKVVLILWFCILGANLLDRLLKRSLYKKVHLEESIQYTLSVAIKYLLLIIGLFVGISALGVDLAALTVFAGTIGIGIGFGLQEIAKNFISGIVMLIERPVKVGDYIEVGGLPGKVREINARGTVVDTFDNISVVVPNSEFMSQQVVNWSYSDKLTRLKLPVGVAYGSDTELVKNSLLEVAKEHPKVLGYPAPSVWFEGFGDSSLNFALFVWTNEPQNRMIIKSDINFMIDQKFRDKGVTIPFPQRDIHFKSSNVELK